MTLDHYLARRHRYEILAWVTFFAIQAVANSVVVWLDIRRAGLDFQAWHVTTWETSSAMVMLALIPVLVWFNNRHPLRRENWRRNLPLHVLFTIPYSLAHVFGMIAIRKLVYFAMDSRYVFAETAGEFATELFYEYLKDARAYAGFLAVIYLYAFILRRLQGEATFIAEGEDAGGQRPGSPERFLVKKLGKEFLVRVDDIDWIESAGNYVTLHVNDRLYPLRDTMTSLERKLDGRGFARVHRSAIVNLDHVTEIEPFDTGDARLHLQSGAEIPVSRRYRAGLREQLG